MCCTPPPHVLNLKLVGMPPPLPPARFLLQDPRPHPLPSIPGSVCRPSLLCVHDPNKREFIENHLFATLQRVGYSFFPTGELTLHQSKAPPPLSPRKRDAPTSCHFLLSFTFPVSLGIPYLAPIYLVLQISLHLFFRVFTIYILYYTLLVYFYFCPHSTSGKDIFPL